ncbi:MAG TPA: hypothetical protein VMM84_14325 [Pyrinomonadaceae bacterium]|nr:hypothetical protein [Pyrinomonadaceae bacterium]
MAGYSGTPLARKLGIKEGSVIAMINAPIDFQDNLGALPENVRIAKSTRLVDLIVLFADSERRLRRDFTKQATRIYPKGMLWIAWPKNSSGRTTDLTFANVQGIGLAAGLVDVKICAIDDVWSGLKFVYRLKDRPAR